MAGEWRDVALEDVADELTVGYVGPMASEYVDDGIPFLRSLNVDPLRINKNDLKFITPEFHSRIRKSRLTPGDVVIVRTGKPGACSVVPEWLADANCSDLVIVRCGPQLDNRFLAYYVNTVACDHVAAHLVGAVQQHFNVGSARALRLNLPPLAEQKAIAAVLGTLDDKIELNRRMNATLEAMARTLFQSWFVDFDPVRANLDRDAEKKVGWVSSQGRNPPLAAPANGGLRDETANPPYHLFPAAFQDSEAGHIPKGWEVTTLSDLTALITKGTTPTQDDMASAPTSDAQINYVRVNSIDEHGSVLADKLTAIPESIHMGALKRSILMANDVLYTIAGTIGRIALAEDWLLPANTNQAVAIIRPAPEIPSGFLILTMRQEVFRTELHNNIVHAVQANLSLGMLAKARIVVPPKSTLPQLFKPIDALLSQISANRTQSRTLATLRDTLLPKLLSGELTVARAAETLDTVA